MNWALFGAGAEGVNLASVLISSNQEVVFFIDNDVNKIGSSILGIPVISFQNFIKKKEHYKIVVAVSETWRKQVEEQLLNAGYVGTFSLQKAYESIELSSDNNLLKYKDLFVNKRCFIIGTGPSLSVSDLDILYKNKEITFASNKIFKVFGKTKWRPDLYCVVDRLVAEQYSAEIDELDIKYMLVAKGILNDTKNYNVDFFNMLRIPYEDNEYPEFSECPDRYVYEGYTVTYAMIQWALYMGFREIYLLGIDFDYGTKELGYKHFCNDYDKLGEIVNAPKLDKSLMAYKKADMVAKGKGVKIYNASRGGKLDVYRRVDFDTLFKCEEAIY